MLRSGYRLPWASFKAPLTSHPPIFRIPADPLAVAALDQEVSALLQKQAVEEITLHSSPGFYGRIFVVPKSSGRWRPVLDLSALNKFLLDLPFKMETPSSVRDSIHTEDWATSVDLADAYFHILIHPRDRKWLRFLWRDKIFQFRALPFGLAPAPWLFTRVVRELCLHLRRKGIRLKVYLDDWLILASSVEACHAHTQEVVKLCLDLGFCPNWEKSVLKPSRQFTFLGISFDTVRWLARPAPHRVSKLEQCITKLMQSKAVPATHLASLLGMMESLAPLIPLGRLHKRRLQRAFRLRWSQTHQPWDELVPLGPWFKEAITHWLDLTWVSKGVAITLPPFQEELFTDASTTGWGAHMGSLSAAGLWSQTQREWHINRLELEAVALALQAFLPQAKGRHIRLQMDNTTVACYLNKQGGARSTTLSARAEELLLWCANQSISLSARHIPGKLNILADALSRPHSILHTEWTLDRRILAPVWESWFRPHVDLFATRFNHRLPVYVSPVADPAAWAVDALSIPWSGLLAYAFPPLPLIGKVLRKAREDNARLILVAPLWEAQPWFPELLFLSHVPPLKLQMHPRALLQPRSGIPHADPQFLNLHAWMLCGSHCQH